MTTRSQPCDGFDLGVLLRGDEGSETFRRAVGHVESCTECQRRLTEASGDADHWSVQREMLRPVAGDQPESGLLYRHRSPESAPWRRHAIDESTVGELLAAPSHPEMLGRLGRYEIERIIGTGGMGIVLKGFDSELNRPVAIKLLAPHLARVGAARQRFAREARAAAAVVHEHVVPIHNVESEHTAPFLVMQFIPGESLQARVEREGPLSVAEILRIGMQAAAGLAAAHAQGLVHRDVKPANILLENCVERAYLTDFGLARASDDASLTYTGVVAGTPHYMSPEQADGQPLDHRSDLFSLGSVLYFMATGHPPFRADRPMAVLKRTCHDPHRPAWQCNAEIPAALSRIIDRLLEKKPSSRFASAGDLEKALSAILVKVRQGGIERRLQSRWRQHPWAIGLALAALVAVGLAIGLGGGLLQRTPSTDNLDGKKELPVAIRQLAAADPSPPYAAHPELHSLSQSLDALEAVPFPEATLSGQRSPPGEDAAHSIHFRGAPWNEVLNWYASIAALPLSADELPDGTFTYADSQQHSLDDITNILQPVLRTKGLMLKRQPNGIQLFRIRGTENGGILGAELPSQRELVERRKALQGLHSRIAELNKQHSAVPADAADRQQQLAIIQANSDSLEAERQTALRILEAEFEEANVVVADAHRLAQQVAEINARSTDCVPEHILFQLQRELQSAQAGAAEIRAVLSVGRAVAGESPQY